MTTQAEFRAALLDAAQPVPGGLVDGHGRPAGRRYDVYRNNIATALGDALATGYPAVAKLLGDANFKSLAARHLRASLPDSPRMMFYGAGFAEALDGTEALRKYPYLGDVARLEYGLRESYHAADAAPAPPDALALEPEALMGARLTLAPPVRVIRSRHPVVSIWRYTLVADSPKPQGGAEDALILRPGFDPEPHVLPPGGADFLTAIKAGRTLGAAFDAARTERFDLARVLGLLIAGNGLTAVTEDTK